MASLSAQLVGRADELGVLEQTLDGLDRGAPGAVEVLGEPGIGKTRMLQELAVRAEKRRHLVLYGSGSQFERDLPFSIFVDALDEYVQGLEPGQLAALDGEVRAELAEMLPSMSGPEDGPAVAFHHERYRSHRAVGALLKTLAAARPLVLVLDDFHWADSASVELLGALLRRPPAAAVLVALALRPRQIPERLEVALERARRSAAMTPIELVALTPDEARELLGETVDADAAALLYEESGGNPFYLDSLARSLSRGGPVAALREGSPTGIGVPPGVAASLREELAPLSERVRLVLEGAAVAGDPFDPELTAAAAKTSEATVIDALDELLALDLVRSTDVPRRFRFRHPLVQRAVYEAVPGGWRLGAHERCADALAARGASAATRAHHVARSAREGDLAAVAVLREAGDAAVRLAPASAAHWLAEALRLLPQTAPARERAELLLARARALTATGHFVEGHAALVDGLVIAPKESIALRVKITRACAAVEQLLGEHDQARARLCSALDSLADPASGEAVDLMIELALNAGFRGDYASMPDWAERAVTCARQLDDPPLTAAAVAILTLATAITGAAERAQVLHTEAAARVDALADDQLARRLDAAAWLAGAEVHLDLFAEADEHAARALAVGRDTGQGETFLVLVQILGRAWFVRGKLAVAGDLLDGAVDSARLLGNTQAMAWNLFNRSLVAGVAGDTRVALASAEEAVELTDGDGDYVAAWAAVSLAAALLDAGQAARAVGVLLDAAGGEDLVLIPGSWRAYCLELLTRCWLALDRRTDAERAAACAERWASNVQLRLAGAWAGRARAAVELDVDCDRAAEQALASAVAAEAAGAPIEAARSRILAGCALARAGRSGRAVAELQRAAAQLDAYGALRYRDEAERELGKLGHRTHRRSRPGRARAADVESLTERELQVARLVVDRRTNAQIAAELFLSQKTVETHLRHIFDKLGVASRVELARAVERSERGAPTPAP